MPVPAESSHIHERLAEEHVVVNSAAPLDRDAAYWFARAADRQTSAPCTTSAWRRCSVAGAVERADPVAPLFRVAQTRWGPVSRRLSGSSHSPYSRRPRGSTDQTSSRGS